MEEHMAMKEKSAVATRGGADGASLKKSIREEERKIEASKGSDLPRARSVSRNARRAPTARARAQNNADGKSRNMPKLQRTPESLS
jgi:hypothetical protein